ncbi:MAG: epoxyqueuosine reductase QueH, partial [Mogibacterium diversum]|nr:epoxyqueuosine reductase QueH [Mogibacterium diversum]
SIGASNNIKFLDVDFKKKNGFGRSIELSKKYGLYRQKFCGCEYARAMMKSR